MTLTAEQQQQVTENLGLITFTMTRMCRIQRDHPHFDDLWQEGAVGLARSTVTYDPTRNIRFSTYACYWIRQRVQRGLGEIQGANWRHAHYKGIPFTATLSLDATHTDTDTLTVGDVVLVDPTNIEDESDADQARMIADMLRCARNDVDRALIAAGLEHPHERPTFRDQLVGARFGMRESTVRRRRLSLAARYRDLVAA